MPVPVPCASPSPYGALQRHAPGTECSSGGVSLGQLLEWNWVLSSRPGSVLVLAAPFRVVSCAWTALSGLPEALLWGAEAGADLPPGYPGALFAVLTNCFH